MCLGLQFNKLSVETPSRRLLSSAAGRTAPVSSASELHGKAAAKSACICAFNTFRIFPCFWTGDKMEYGCLSIVTILEATGTVILRKRYLESNLG